MTVTVALLAGALVFAVLLIVLLVVALVVSTSFAIRYGRMVLSWEENMGLALDRLDDAYASMSQILQRPLFYDSPEIKQVVADIVECRDAVLWVANSLSMPARPFDARASQIEVSS